jgi:hypothetical protein
MPPNSIYLARSEEMGNEIITTVKINYSQGTTPRVVSGNSAPDWRVIFCLEYGVESSPEKLQKI